MSGDSKHKKPKDSDSDFGGPACCILEICCGGEKQIKALADLIAKELHWGEVQSENVARWLLTHFDFAPKGSLSQFKRAVAKFAREYPPEPGY